MGLAEVEVLQSTKDPTKDVESRAELGVTSALRCLLAGSVYSTTPLSRTSTPEAS